jgi:ribose 1,5-bisphosphokinase PhnN
MTDDELGAHKGILLVISSPSGAGKTTLAHLLAEQERLEFSVSYTTRGPRTGERDGVDYKYVTEDEFTRMVDRNFLQICSRRAHDIALWSAIRCCLLSTIAAMLCNGDSAASRWTIF